jgi:hypothetical protein
MEVQVAVSNTSNRGREGEGLSTGETRLEDQDRESESLHQAAHLLKVINIKNI